MRTLSAKSGVAGALVSSLSITFCISACGSGSPDAPLRGEFEDLFIESRRWVLQEPDSAPLSRLEVFVVDESGRAIVPDKLAATVKRYGPDGELEASYGRFGEGPGEFEAPRDVVIGPSQGVYVADSNERLTRLTSSLAFDRVFRLEVPNFIGGVDRVGDTLIVHKVLSRAAGHDFAFYDFRGSFLGSFSDRHPLVQEVPYWTGPWITYLAVAEDGLYVANNLVYPIYRYSREGVLLDSVGTPPKSWIQARKPDLGEFMGPSAGPRYQEWRRSFTQVAGLEVIDGPWLVVIHTKYRDDITEYLDPAYFRADLYDGKGLKWYEDVELPGRVVGSADGLLIVIEEPPEPWVVAEYRMR